MSILKLVDEQLTRIDIPYEFMEWTQAVTYPYFTGELTEETVQSEGHRVYRLLLNGFSRGPGSYAKLEGIRERIREHFDADYGLRLPKEDGCAVIFYDGAFYVPTGEAELKRIQINLFIQEWTTKGE